MIPICDRNPCGGRLNRVESEQTGYDYVRSYACRAGNCQAGYKVVSSKEKNPGGPYKPLEAAKKRLRQVEFFKRSK